MSDGDLTIRAKGRDYLDEQVCTTPGCGCGGVMWVHGTCHPHAALTVIYYAGTLYLECAECSHPVSALAVADKTTLVGLPPEITPRTGGQG